MMNKTLIFLSLMLPLYTFAQDGVWLPPTTVSPGGVMNAQGFRIQDHKVKLVSVVLSSEGVQSVNDRSAFLNEEGIYLGDMYADDIDTARRERHLYCDTTYASAKWTNGVLEIRRWTLRKEVTFTCPLSKKPSKRGEERGPRTEVIYNLSNLEYGPLIQTTIRNQNENSRGIAPSFHTTNSTQSLVRISE